MFLLWRNTEIPNDILRQQKSFAVALRKQDNPKAHLCLRRHLALLDLRTAISRSLFFTPRGSRPFCYGEMLRFYLNPNEVAFSITIIKYIFVKGYAGIIFTFEQYS